MPYSTPKTNWSEDDTGSPEAFNRIEGNIKYIKEETATISGNKTFTGNNTHSGTNTFSDTVTNDGNIVSNGTITDQDGERIDQRIDQDVRTTASPTLSGLTLNGAFDPTTSPTGVTKLLVAGGSWDVPRGVYMMAFNTSYEITGSIYVSGAYRQFVSSNDVDGCMVFSDGSNVRFTLVGPGGSSGTIYYLKF